MIEWLDTTPSDDILFRFWRIFSLASVRLSLLYVIGSNHCHVSAFGVVCFKRLIVFCRISCIVFDGNKGKIFNDLTNGPGTHVRACNFVDAGLNGCR